MTTTTVPLTIVCPDWCTDTPQCHLEELWQMECNCLHWSPLTVVEDEVGLQVDAFGPRRHCSPARVGFSIITTPDGRETQSPVVMINDTEMSLEQAEKFAQAIADQIAGYRAWKAGT